MNKPTTLLIEEFKQNITKLVSESELPVFILEYLIRDLHTEIANFSIKIAQQEKTEYIQSQEKELDKVSDSSNLENKN